MLLQSRAIPTRGNPPFVLAARCPARCLTLIPSARTSIGGFGVPLLRNLPKQSSCRLCAEKKDGPPQTFETTLKDGVPVNKTSLMALKKGVLVEELRIRGCSTLGKKSALVARLLEALEKGDTEELKESSEPGDDISDPLHGSSRSSLAIRKKAELEKLCDERGLGIGSKEDMVNNLMAYLEGKPTLQASVGEGSDDADAVQEVSIPKSPTIDSSTTEAELNKMKVGELRAFLKENGIKAARVKKAILIERILDFLQGDQTEVEQEESLPEVSGTDAVVLPPQDEATGGELSQLEDFVVQIVEGMSMKVVRSLTKAELVKLVKNSGLSTKGTKNQILENIEKVYEETTKGDQKGEGGDEAAESHQSLEDSDPGPRQNGTIEEAEDPPLSSPVRTNEEEDEGEDFPFVQNKILFGDEKVILNELLEEMHQVYGDLFEDNGNSDEGIGDFDESVMDEILASYGDEVEVRVEDLQEASAWADSHKDEFRDTDIQALIREKPWRQDDDITSTRVAEDQDDGGMLSSGRTSGRRQRASAADQTSQTAYSFSAKESQTSVKASEQEVMESAMDDMDSAVMDGSEGDALGSQDLQEEEEASLDSESQSSDEAIMQETSLDAVLDEDTSEDIPLYNEKYILENTADLRSADAKDALDEVSIAISELQTEKESGPGQTDLKVDTIPPDVPESTATSKKYSDGYELDQNEESVAAMSEPQEAPLSDEVEQQDSVPRAADAQVGLDPVTASTPVLEEMEQSGTDEDTANVEKVDTPQVEETAAVPSGIDSSDPPEQEALPTVIAAGDSFPDGEEESEDAAEVEMIRQKVIEQRAALATVQNEIKEKKERIQSIQQHLQESSRKQDMDLKYMEQLLQTTKEIKAQRHDWQKQMQENLEHLREDAKKYDGKQEQKVQLESTLVQLEEEFENLEDQIQEKDRKADELRDSINRAIQEYGLMPPGYPTIGSDSGENGLMSFPPNYSMGHNGIGGDNAVPMDLQIDPGLLPPVSYDLAQPIQLGLKDPVIEFDSGSEDPKSGKAGNEKAADSIAQKGDGKQPVVVAAASFSSFVAFVRKVLGEKKKEGN